MTYASLDDVRNVLGLDPQDVTYDDAIAMCLVTATALIDHATGSTWVSDVPTPVRQACVRAAVALLRTQAPNLVPSDGMVVAPNDPLKGCEALLAPYRTMHGVY